MAGNRRKRRVKRRRGPRRLRIPLSGGLIRGRMHPPTTSASPWNSYTVTTIWKATAADKGGKFCLTAKEVETATKAELGIADKIDMRISRVDIWTPPAFQNNDSNCVVFSPVDWTHRDGCKIAQLNWYESWGTSVQPAHAHYVWPRSISNQVIPDGKDFPVMLFDIIAGQQFLLKIHLLWRANNPVPRADSGVLISVRKSRRQSGSADHSFEDLADIAQLAM